VIPNAAAEVQSNARRQHGGARRDIVWGTAIDDLFRSRSAQNIAYQIMNPGQVKVDRTVDYLRWMGCCCRFDCGWSMMVVGGCVDG
jgi:hypothetical protein